MKKHVFGIVGATASGKTALSIRLAQALQGEIVCMDSMQVYRRMDIGTAKPTAPERAAAPHHMLDVVDPEQDYSVSQYAADAKPFLERIATPILVGGTGLYLRALSLPLSFGYVKGDEVIRQKYHDFLTAQGKEALHALLSSRDEKTAARLHINDTRRVIRALEVFDITGKPFSAQEMPDEADSEYKFSLYAPDMPREVLYERINQRVDDMLAQGLLAEVEMLLKSGVPRDAQAMQGLGYKELIPVLDAQASLKDATELIKQRTRNYAKRQLTWFRADKRIRWLSLENGIEHAIKEILKEQEEHAQ